MTQPNNPGPGQNDSGTGGHPAWDEVLNLVPEDSRPTISEKLSAWDQGVQKRFTELQSEYQPWKELTDGGFTPQDVQTAVQIAQALQNDPQAFYNHMAETYGFNSGQGQGGQGQQDSGVPDPNESEEIPPELQKIFDERFGKLEQSLGAVAQYLESQRTQTEEQQAITELQNTLGALEKQHGEFDYDFVLAKIAAGVEPEKAVQQYMEKYGTQQASQNGDNLPPILGAGGGLPSNQQFDPAKMGDRETRDLVANLVKAAQSQS